MSGPWLGGEAGVEQGPELINPNTAAWPLGL